MATLQEIRQQYPQYNDMSDQQLADAMHSKFYSDMPKDQFYKKIGFSGQQPQQQGDQTLNFIIGAGDSIRDMIAGAANLIPGVNLPTPKLGSGTTYNIGRGVGDVAGFIGGGEVLDTARAGAEAIPAIGKFAKALGGEGKLSGAARRTLGGGAYGLATNPDERGTGAAEGAGLSLATEALPLPFKAAAQATKLFKPQEYAEGIMQSLSGGKSLEDNSKDLADAIKNAYTSRIKEGTELYSPVFSKLGENNIYEEVSPFSSSYQNLDKNIVKNFKYDSDLKDLHQKFIENPTLQNAHNLQSQLGSSIRDSSKGNLSIADKNIVKGYQKAQSSLKDDISSFLKNSDPEMAEQYETATQNWRENVIPYVENKKISGIAKGDITNPRAITNIFKNPEEDINKVVEDLGDDAKRKILYSEVGKVSDITPERLQKAFADLDKKGLGSYLTPELEKSQEELTKRMRNRDLAQRIGGALGGSAVAPGAGEAAGAIIGAMAAPAASKTVGSLSPLARAISEIAKMSYRPASKAVIATTVPE